MQRQQKYETMKLIKPCFALLIILISTGTSAQSRNDSLRAMAKADSMLRALPSVSVKGERPTVKGRDGKLIYNMPAILKDHPADNAYDAIKLIPGISEDNDKLQLMNQPVTVVIDGKATTLTAEQIYTLLKTIPSSRIKDAEVMLSAPARYGVKGAMISINLHHGATSQTPLQGEIYGAARQKHDCNFEERVNLAAAKGKWTADLLYDHLHGNYYGWRNTTSHHTLANGEARDFISNNIVDTRRHNHSWRLGADYNLGVDHSLSFAYNGKYSTGHNYETTSLDIESKSRHSGTSTLQNARADYQAPFGLKAALEYTFYTNPGRQTLNSTIANQTLHFIALNRQRINRWKLSVGQTHNLGTWSLNYGLHCQTSTDNGLQTYERLDPTSAETPGDIRTRHQEEIANLYAGLTKNLGNKLSADLSLAAEYYHSYTWHRWDLYPSLNLNYQPANGHMLQLSFASQKDFPPYSVLKNTTTYTDGGYGLVIGNPYLQPAGIYKTQLVYILKNKYQFSIWYNYTSDYFMQTPYQSTEQYVLNYKFLNYDFSAQWGIMASLPLSIGKCIKTRANFMGLWKKEKDTDFYDMAFNRDRAFIVINLMNAFVISKKHDLTLNVDGNWRTTSVQATYTIPSTWQADISLQHNFANKKASLRLYANDIFETQHPDPYIRYAGQHMDMKLSCYREIGLSFSYRFGGYKEKQHKQLDTKRF